MNTGTMLPVLGALGLLVVLATVVALLRYFGRGVQDKIAYEAVTAVLTAAERSFFGVLQQAVDDCQIFAKVRLADIIQPAQGLARGPRQAAFNRIKSKHVDFAVCDSKTLRVIGVIELDDSSHAGYSRQERDKFMDEALTSAGIPVLRVPARQTYSPAKLREKVQQEFSSRKSSSELL